MLTATHPLGAVVSPSRHGPPSSSSSFPSSTASPAGQWAPRRAAATVLPSKVSCTRVSVSEVVNNDPAVGTVDYETLSATLTVRMDEGWSTPENVADMAHRPWLFLKFVSSELDPGELGNQPILFNFLVDVHGWLIDRGPYRTCAQLCSPTELV